MRSTAPLGRALEALREARLDELTFALPGAVGVLLGGAALLALLFARKGRAPALTFSRGEALAALPHAGARALVLAPRVLLFAAMVLALLALARPQAPGAPAEDEVEGIDIVVVLDISGSMRAADFKPRDRLFVAKMLIAEHLFSRVHDRIGVVIFAGEAFTQAPLTHDKGLLTTLLDGVRTGVITDGTAIGDAVATGVNRLRDSEAKGKAIILLTDGDNNAGAISPEKAAELAAAMKIPLFPVLVGKGGRVPVPTGGRDVLGMPRYEYAVIPVNPELLRSMAKTTGGRFFSAESPEELATSLQRILSELEQTQLASGPAVRKPVELYPLALLAALLMLTVALALKTTRASVLP
jgi:Ca-activated chloride channel homolog